MKEQFKLLENLKTQLEALEKGLKDEIEIWVDLPAHFNDQTSEEEGLEIPLKLGIYELSHSESTEDEIDQKEILKKTESIKTPLRLRIYPEDCERRYRAEKISVRRFFPPQEIIESLGLNSNGFNKEGVRMTVYPLYQQNGIMTQEITISRKRIYMKVTEYSEDVNQGNILRPHFAFVNYSIAKNFPDQNLGGIEDLALESKGTSETFIPNFGKIFLKAFQILKKFCINIPFESPKTPQASLRKVLTVLGKEKAQKPS